ncbi:MAG: potassium transporter TrkG [Eggerthellales bacterium]|nr:potassium transporter TrkG [Eggerthellales bacterium]
MWQRFTFYDFRMICHYLGVLVSFNAAALAIPAITGVLLGEWEPASRYFMAAGVSLVIGAIMQMALYEPGDLNSQQALAVTAFSWIVLAIIGAIPLFFSGHFGSYLDALFEAVSGWTVTGASVISDLNHLSYADNMWRFSMHLFGGMGLVVIALSLGMLGRGSSGGLYSLEGHTERVVPNVVKTTRLIASISLIFIGVFGVLLTIMCLLSGMEPLRSALHGFWIAISGFMTAGFTPTDSNIYYYHSFVMELLIMVVMLMGGINFSLYVELWKGRFFSFWKDTELRTMALWLLILVAVFTLSLTSSELFDGATEMARRGLFMVFSAASTAGFATVTQNQMVTVFSSGAVLVLAAAMAVGLSCGSTAGGIKIGRISTIFKSIMATVKQAASPDSMKIVSVYHHLGRRVVDEGMVKAAMTIFALFIMTYALGTLAGIAHGYDAVSAIFDAISMASNGGLSSGIISADMPATLELVYIVEMLAGRIEFVALIALLIKIVVSVVPRPKEEA